MTIPVASMIVPTSVIVSSMIVAIAQVATVSASNSVPLVPMFPVVPVVCMLVMTTLSNDGHFAIPSVFTAT
jgi:hypothetical protein